MNKSILLTTAVIVLASCTSPEITMVHTEFDPFTQHRWTSIQGPMDMAGGMRQTLMCPADMYGRMESGVPCYSTSGPGTLQGFMAGGFGGLMEGAGLATGMAMLRPATTAVNNAVNAGNSGISPGGVVATASPVAAGGAGGAGGRGGRGGTGGAGGIGQGGSGGVGYGGAGGAGGMATAAGGAGGNIAPGAVSATSVGGPVSLTSSSVSNPSINTSANAISRTNPNITNVNTVSPTISATGGNAASSAIATSPFDTRLFPR